MVFELAGKRVGVAVPKSSNKDAASRAIGSAKGKNGWAGAG